MALPVHDFPLGKLPLIRSEIEFLGALGRARKSLITPKLIEVRRNVGKCHCREVHVTEQHRAGIGGIDLPIAVGILLHRDVLRGLYAFYRG